MGLKALDKDKLTELGAISAAETAPEASSEIPILVFPLSLRNAGGGPQKECIRFTIVDRKALNDKKSIYLYNFYIFQAN